MVHPLSNRWFTHLFSGNSSPFRLTLVELLPVPWTPS
jgi:hypothetical protein